MNPELIKSLAVKTDSRIFHLVIDGLGGLPHPDTGKTELETANAPNLDKLAAEGILGLSIPIDFGITPGSGPAHLGLFGYEPVENVVGRGILDISGVDFEFHPGDVAARVNFCTVDKDGLITDRRAGRIPDEEGKRVCQKLQAGVKIDGCEVFIVHTKEYRGGIVLRKPGGLRGQVKDTDPQKVGFAPLQAEPLDQDSQEAADLLNEIVRQASKIIKDEPKANMLLLRGVDDYRPLVSFQELYKLSPLCNAVYPMYRGVARLVGMDLVDHPTTATLDDQFVKLEEEWAGESKHDYIFFHVKKTDSAGEDGDFDKKVHVIEDLDALLPRLMKLKPDVIVVSADHSTPSTMSSHSWHPLPTLIWAKNCRRDACMSFGETAAIQGGLGQFKSIEQMPLAMANAGKLLKFGA